MRAARIRPFRLAPLAAILFALVASPAAALEFPDFDWDGTRAQEVTSSIVDLTIVRPVATVRVVIGSVLFVPAALLSAPMGREGFDGALDTLITAPSEFAFDREIGQL